jgi:signal transduction histidine kinase
MGEMASAVAHELNQPLTAITNYCNGMVSRVRGDTIDKDDLLAALEKTARQAERAGQIIQRIRAFVKRSEPQRQPSQAADRRGRGRPGRHRAAPPQRGHPHLRGAAPAHDAWSTRS